MRTPRTRSALAISLALGLVAARVDAVTIVPDFSGLGTTIRVDASGKIVSSGGTDVTAAFKANLETAMNYWESAVSKNWTLNVAFVIGDLGSGTIGTSNATARLGTAPRHITDATITFNNDSSVAYFIDSTPWENSEFDITLGTSSLGGGTLNTDRRGGATASGGALDRWDLLTLALHELEHSLAFDRDEPIFLAALETTPNRHITIDKTLSGLPNDFDVRITDPSAHIDAVAQASMCSTVVALAPCEWGAGERALITAVDALAVCQINQCTQAQVNTSPVPEPGSGLLLAAALAALGGWRRARARR
jgi:hypothetical protein